MNFKAAAVGRRNIGLIILAAFVVRTAVLAGALLASRRVAVLYTPDTETYLEPAKSLVTTGRFAAHGVPELERTPGYPLLIVPGLILGSPEIVTAILQVVLSCATVFLVHRLAIRVFRNENAARLAALLYAFEPLSILYSAKILSETLFTFFIALYLLAFIVYLRVPSLRLVVLSAVALAAATYVRPVGLFLPFFTAVVIAVTVAARRSWMTTAVHALVFLAVCHVSLGIWQVRNWRQTGYTGFSSIPDVNLYCYDAAWVLSAVQRKPFTEAQQELGCGDTSAYLEVHPDQRRLSRAERYVAMRREGLKLIASEPITFALARAKGTFRSVVNPGGAEWVTLFGVYPRSQELTGQVLDKGLLRTAISLVTGKPHLFWMNICLEVVLLSSYGFAFMALFEQQVRCSRAVWVLLAVFVYFVLISGGAVGTSRFRHPVMPIVAIFAGYGLAHVSVWIRGRRRTGAPQRKGREGAT